MSKLTLDEAIKHCEEVAEQNETKALRIGRQYKGTLLDRDAKECRRCAAEHRQLAEWLVELKDLRDENKDWKEEYANLNKISYGFYEELKEAKRFLKVAVEDLEKIASVDECSFPYCDNRCPFECVGQCEEKHWKHKDEALKLIGEDGDTNG